MISGMQNVPQISCYRVYLEISVFDCCSRIGALWKVLKDLTYVDQLLYKISVFSVSKMNSKELEKYFSKMNDLGENAA